MADDADPTTGQVVAIPEGFDTVPLNIAVLDEHWLIQWTPTLPQIIGALSMARAKNLMAPAALDGFRRKLRTAEREKNLAVGLAVHRLREEFGNRPTMTELRDLAYALDDRVIAAAEAYDSAWLEYEYAKDFADAVATDVTLLQSIAKKMKEEQP
ncbi:hypothetical protein [Microbacterium testaceum]|uniref:Uncharacterized protein n=1 Tax=Microbacterium testaceum TaxID=2033 RepID=A0A147F5A5_MICTE|nr:hypothetical protein [Microbacterium testaceum]KTS09060.1 hypothetical protein RSA3_14270 [Microbacterium testaceum]